MELVYGQSVKIPGDIVGGDLKPDSDLTSLLKNVQQKTYKPAVPTAHHSTPDIHMPANMDTATHVYVKRGKTTPSPA